ncbi:FtsW/RodA/SpoVE family cell cycle protein, partial [Saccharophagus degradans]
VLYSRGGQSEHIVKRQLIVFGVAYSVMFVEAQLDLQMLRRWAPWFYVAGVGLLVLVFFFGVGSKGAQRWLSLGFIRFQPSE